MPKIGTTKDKIDKLDFTKIKNFSISKDTIKKVKDNPQNKRKYWQSMNLIKDLYYYIKNYYNSTIKRQITQFNNEQRILIDMSPKKICK